MDQTVINYKIMAAEEFVKGMDENLSEEERNKHLAMGAKLNQTYRELAECEHEYNNPLKERKDRNSELAKVLFTGAADFFSKLIITGLFVYVDTKDDAIPGFGLKECLKRIRFK